MRKDYYKILGISDEEKKLNGKDFEKIVKSKFRKLSLKYHPDKQQDKSDSEKKEAEERFKEIAEAYEVLSSEKKRQEYDNPTSGFNFDGFGDFSDFMKGFGFGFNGGKQRVNKGQSIRIRFSVSLEDIYNGASKTIKYKRMDKCPTCGGSGKGENTRVETCQHCGGTGQIFEQNGFMQRISTCPHCNGKGSILINPCVHCNGNGLVQTENTVQIDIPKGTPNGAEITMRGQGSAPIGGEGVYGDLYVLIAEQEHPIFERHGNDLYFVMNISVLDGITGCSVEVNTIDGKKLSTKIQKLTEDGTQIRFSGKGMPIMNYNSYGNMIGIVKLNMPKEINDDDIEAINQIKERENFK